MNFDIDVTVFRVMFLQFRFTICGRSYLDGKYVPPLYKATFV